MLIRPRGRTGSSPTRLTGLSGGNDVDLAGFGRGLLRRGLGGRFQGQLIGGLGEGQEFLAVAPALLHRVGGDLGGQLLPALFPLGDVPVARTRRPPAAWAAAARPRPRRASSSCSARSRPSRGSRVRPWPAAPAGPARTTRARPARC